MRTCLSFVLALVLSVAACGKDKSPTSPASPSNPGTGGSSGVSFGISMLSSGAFTAKIAGTNYAGQALLVPSQFTLPAGVQTVEGTFTGFFLDISVLSGSGSIVPGSFKVLQGPTGPSVTQCGVHWQLPVPNTTAAILYKVEFQVQSSASGSCHLGAV